MDVGRYYVQLNELDKKIYASIFDSMNDDERQIYILDRLIKSGKITIFEVKNLNLSRNISFALDCLYQGKLTHDEYALKLCLSRVAINIKKIYYTEKRKYLPKLYRAFNTYIKYLQQMSAAYYVYRCDCCGKVTFLDKYEKFKTETGKIVCRKCYEKDEISF